MAKKATVTKKAASGKAASKKPASGKPASGKKKTSTNAKKAPNAAVTPVIHFPQNTNVAAGERVDLLPPSLVESTIVGLTSLMEGFRDVADNNLTAIQRRRKIGAGIRNYGFIEKVADLAAANPQYAQFFRISDLENCIRNVDMCRDIVVLLQAFTRLASNAMLIYSDEAFRMALIYYNMVKEMSRRGDPSAMEIFRALQPFFRRPRRTTGDPPTQKQIERDIHALMNDTADGKIVIENERPRASAGKRVLVDEVSRSRAAVKETGEEEIDE